MALHAPLEVLDRALHDLLDENVPDGARYPAPGIDGERVGRQRGAVATILEHVLAVNRLDITFDVVPCDQVRRLIRVAQGVGDLPYLRVDLEPHITAATLLVEREHLHPLDGRL